jgi:hypothetical protein
MKNYAPISLKLHATVDKSPSASHTKFQTLPVRR